MKVREGGRIISQAVTITVMGSEDGKRGVPGVASDPSKAEAFWTEVLRSLAACGLPAP